jgi:hypothetical protein
VPIFSVQSTSRRRSVERYREREDLTSSSVGPRLCGFNHEMNKLSFFFIGRGLGSSFVID